MKVPKWSPDPPHVFIGTVDAPEPVEGPMVTVTDDAGHKYQLDPSALMPMQGDG